MTRTQLGTKIRKAREARGLSLRQAAEQLKVDWSYYRGIETGERSLGKYARPIAQLYGFDPEELEALAHQKLPNFGPYLRAKYALDDAAIAELEQHFEEVSKQRRPRSRRAS
jgi:transcriptional regulator with XRE-family HTH domain